MKEFLKTKTEEIDAHIADKNNPHEVDCEQIGAAPSDHTHSASSIGASPSDHKHSASDVGAPTKAEHNELKDALTQYLPLTGGTLSGESLYLAEGYARLYGSSGVASIMSSNSKDNSDNRRSLEVFNSGNKALVKDAVQLVDRVNGSSTNYKIFGTHNKPHGYYTGNGNSASRTIDIGGISSAILINGNGYSSLVSVFGTSSVNTNGIYKSFGNDVVKFHNGVLTLATTSNEFNANGATYYWEVL